MSEAGPLKGGKKAGREAGYIERWIREGKNDNEREEMAVDVRTWKMECKNVRERDE